MLVILKKTGRWLTSLLLAVFMLAAAVAQEGSVRYRVLTDKPFTDVVEEVEFAITEHNFRITGSNRIGAVISSRAGAAFPDSLVIHFCNLEYARQFLEVEPDYLLYMPCKVAVAEQEDQVVIETLLLPEDDPRLHAISVEVNAILRAIVDFAAE